LIGYAMGLRSRQNGGFDVFRMRGWKLWVSNRLRPYDPARPAGSARQDGVRGPFDRVNSSRFSRVWRCRVSFFGTVESLYIKQYLHRSVWDVIKHLFRPSRARRACRASLMLIENGFLSPEVIAVGELKYGFLPVKAFLITRELAPDQRRTKRNLIAAFGEMVGRMHATGIFHGDLRPGNVFAENTPRGWRFFLLDNERTRRFGRLPYRLAVKNLVQIGMLDDHVITPTDRMRFLKSYLAQNRRFGGDYKKLAGKVFSKTRMRMAGRQPVGGFTRQR